MTNDAGMSLDEMNARLVEMGFSPQVATYPKFTKGFRISNEAEAGLVRLAEEFHFHHGTAVSVSAFLEALGQGTLRVTTRSFTEEKSNTE